MRMSLASTCVVLVLGLAVRAQQQSRIPATAPRPIPNVTVQRTQANRPSVQRQPAPGVIMGYVYWDVSSLKHVPPNDCSGLSATVNAGGGSLGTFSTGHFTYIPSVGTLGVCAYAVNQMPVGVNLQVLVNVTNAAAFSPAALPSGGVASINIMGGTDLCNNLPPAVPSPADLSQHWWTCPNYAYNVNFILVRAPGSLSSRMAGPVRVTPGTSVELNPQPYPPKNGALLASGEQKTLLGAQANSTSGDGSKSALLPAVQRAAITDGNMSDGSLKAAPGSTLGSSQPMSAQGNTSSKAGSAPIPLKGQGRNEYEAMTVQRGVTQDKSFANWANSAQAPSKGSSVRQQAGTTALATRAGSLAATRVPVAIQENPNLYVAQACAKDPSFRILFVTGTSDGKTLTVGPQYTIWGCSFGNMPPVKRPAPPVTSPSQNHTAFYPSYYNVAVWTSQPFIIDDGNTVSWSDNAVVVTFLPRPANHPGPSTAGSVLPAQVLVTRGDGQTTIYGGEGGVYFRLVN